MGRKKVLKKVDENDEPIVDSAESKSESKELSDDIYDEKQSEAQLEEDEISPEEAGFMEGYESPNMIHCKKCKKKLKAVDLEHCKEVVEGGETVWLCSECCEN
ncbi:MAG: hypothetical protein NTZ73_03260 [Candidatus Diapherotrites archaeon]|nr:hypothetical protein [Candidatus Diapherotrites archaeon]